VPYSPQNPSVYQAAFAGALGGIAVNNAPVLDPVPTDYLPADAIAGAWAQAVDTVWAGASADCLELAVCTSASEAYFQKRSVSPQGLKTFSLDNDWLASAGAIAALMVSADTYFASQSIAVVPCGGGTGGTGATGTTGATGSAGTAGATGAIGATGATGSVGTLSFSHFFGLGNAEGDPDYSTTVAVGAAVPFPQAGPTSGAATAASSSTFTLVAGGDYEVKWQVSVTEAGQLQLAIGGTGLPDTVVGRATGTDQILGNTIITATAGQVLSVINPAGNAAALTVTPIAGGSSPISGTLSITKVG
jgi:hypothetical protein